LFTYDGSFRRIPSTSSVAVTVTLFPSLSSLVTWHPRHTFRVFSASAAVACPVLAIPLQRWSDNSFTLLLLLPCVMWQS
jgi:hypothetical protein